MMPVHLEKEECNQNEDLDPTGKIKPTSIVKLGENVFFQKKIILIILIPNP